MLKHNRTEFLGLKLSLILIC